MKVKVAIDVHVDPRNRKHCSKRCQCLDVDTVSCFLRGDAILGEALRVKRNRPCRTKFCIARQVR